MLCARVWITFNLWREWPYLARILGGEGEANQPGAHSRRRPFLGLFLENQHEVGQEEEEVDGAEQNVGAPDGKG